MSTLTISAERDAAYRARLCRLLQIPEQPDDQMIHKLIEAGFPAVTLQALVDTCALSQEACKQQNASSSGTAPSTFDSK
ncbi:hypothetical protein [Pseudomonas sp. McL0111]|uniref:hypothetical protein n=1 Tax=Pseudomonas sp. McL0111 TaxID=3457357 RepID=UPI00403E7869